MFSIMRAIIESIISPHYVLHYVPRVLVIFGKQKFGIVFVENSGNFGKLGVIISKVGGRL